MGVPWGMAAISALPVCSSFPPGPLTLLVRRGLRAGHSGDDDGSVRTPSAWDEASFVSEVPKSCRSVPIGTTFETAPFAGFSVENLDLNLDHAPGGTVCVYPENVCSFESARVKAAAHPCRDKTEHTQCSPALFVISLSTILGA